MILHIVALSPLLVYDTTWWKTAVQTEPKSIPFFSLWIRHCRTTHCGHCLRCCHSMTPTTGDLLPSEAMHEQALLEIGDLPSAKTFAECIPSGTQ